MSKKPKKTANLQKQPPTSKLEAVCQVDSEALDIVTNLHILEKTIDHLQISNHRDYKISCELDVIKSKVQRAHDLARKILLSNHDYYTILYEREKSQQ